MKVPANYSALSNIHDITDLGAAEKLESDVTAIRLAELGQNPMPPAFDLQHASAIHAHLYSDLYEWAGQFRDFSGSSKIETSDGTLTIKHPDPEKMIDGLVSLFEDIRSVLEQGKFDGMKRGDVAHHVSNAMAGVFALQPFPAGNELVAIQVGRDVARLAGMEIYDTISYEPRPGELQAAMALYSQGKPDLLDTLVSDSLGPYRQSPSMQAQIAKWYIAREKLDHLLKAHGNLPSAGLFQQTLDSLSQSISKTAAKLPERERLALGSTLDKVESETQAMKKAMQKDETYKGR
ncbi:MAG: Fic family protein [Gammaproteobacteria bacterium]|nr:Fic family protein [Gammaproteobacteria bacterium]